ncbi:MAG: ABC transporter ATP-binding protein [Gammaproteobacteria bacterium]|nr:ABC transporter ATP-binding protein [Gammaproteobacteria bacterium]MCP5200836.1 ABC transporter ATP-binding protein [Gammaproteobacteria bacterium]
MNAPAETVVRVDGAAKKFCRELRRSLWYGLCDLGRELAGRPREDALRGAEFWAVDGVDLEVRRGECVALIGHNGAGKTTLLRMLNGLIKPDRGRIEMHGRVGALIALGAGFSPVLTGRENVFVNAAVLGASRAEARRRFDDIVEFAELGEFIDSPVQHYSSGMFVRLGFAVAVHFQPDVLLVDEALAVGDIAFITRCLNRIAELRRQGTGVVFVSHNEMQVREAAQRCVLMHHGRATPYADVDDAFRAYGSLADRNRRDVDAGYVHDGVVRITAARIGPRNGGGRLGTGDDASLELDVETDAACPAAELHLRVWTPQGQLITELRPLARGQRFDLPAGRSRVVVDIDDWPLPPRRYRFAGGFRRDGEVLGWSRDLAFVDVDGAGEAWLGEGLVMLRASARLVPGTAA